MSTVKKNQTPASRKGKGGPKTEAGKQAASRNATKHGLYAQTLDAFAPADRAAFEALHLEYLEQLQPRDLVEQELIHQLAFNRFRFYRFLRVQQAAFADPATPITTLHSIERALTHLDRAYQKTLLLLRDLKKEPMTAQTEPKPEYAIVDIDLPTRSIGYTSDPDLEDLLDNAETNSDDDEDDDGYGLNRTLTLRVLKPTNPKGWVTP